MRPQSALPGLRYVQMSIQNIYVNEYQEISSSECVLQRLDVQSDNTHTQSMTQGLVAKRLWCLPQQRYLTCHLMALGQSTAQTTAAKAAMLRINGHATAKLQNPFHIFPFVFQSAGLRRAKPCFQQITTNYNNAQLETRTSRPAESALAD